MKSKRLLAQKIFLTTILILCSCCGSDKSQTVTKYSIQPNVVSSKQSGISLSPSSFLGSWVFGQDSYLDFVQDHTGYFTEKIGSRNHIKSFKWEKNGNTITIHCYLWEVMDQGRCVIGREINETKYVQIISQKQIEMEGKYFQKEY